MSKIHNIIDTLLSQGYTMDEITNGLVELVNINLDNIAE